ncbi:MAG: FMN-binding protein, partial [Fibrobacteres bacterium]|nr:FMN-binding protein [Fibrobacterota bacterium]
KITKFGGNIESISGASISSHAFTSALNEAVILAKERIPCVVPDSSILDSLKVTK